MDSGVSRIQMWQEQKTKERQEKRRAHYEETVRKLLKRLWKPQRKLEKPRMDNYDMFQLKMPQRNAGLNKISRSYMQLQKIKGNLGKRKMAGEPSKRYHHKKKDQNVQAQVEATSIEVTGPPF